MQNKLGFRLYNDPKQSLWCITMIQIAILSHGVLNTRRMSVKVCVKFCDPEDPTKCHFRLFPAAVAGSSNRINSGLCPTVLR